MMPPAKRRKVGGAAIEEITFNPSARHEFLTGFHRRKVQRTKQAQEKAAERERLDRVAERKKIRDTRKADLERHVQQVNAMLKSLEDVHGIESNEGDDSDNDKREADGKEGLTFEKFDDLEPEPIDKEAEYIDEDKYTIVTVETVDVSRDGLSKIHNEEAKEVYNDANCLKDHTFDGTVISNSSVRRTPKRPWTAAKSGEKVKKPRKRRNFRYEGKGERKVARAKEKVKNHKQAQARRAG